MTQINPASFSQAASASGQAVPVSFQPAAPVLDFGQYEDRDLTRRIVGFISAHGLLGGASLRLKVSGGHVELGGTVATFRQRDRIETFVRRVAGVHHVTNQLAVGTPSFDSASRQPLRGPTRAGQGVVHRTASGGRDATHYFQD